MKKKTAISIGVGLAMVAAVTAAVLLWPKKFALSDEYYGKDGFENIDAERLRNLITQKKSFALLISKPACTASTDFEKVVTEFSEKYQIAFEKIDFVEMREAELIEELRYNPSVALYREGELVTFLSASDDGDLEAYQSEVGFTRWWGKYAKIQK